MSVASEFEVKNDKFQCLFTKMPIKPYVFYLWNANVIRFRLNKTLETYTKKLEPSKQKFRGFFYVI